MQMDTALSPYQQMSFPLNVYAQALLLDQGEVNYLHYGLFKSENMDLASAQNYSTELVLARLPKPPCRLLEIGVGLGTTLQRLAQMGYDCYGISPDEAQIQFIKTQWADAPIDCISLEALKATEKRFDCILFQESAQYIDPLVIFNQAVDLLTDTGTLLIIDEFALKRVELGAEGLHLIDDLLALATRFNFDLVDHQDLSNIAAPTLDYLLNVTEKHRPALLSSLDCSVEQLEQLDQSNRCYQEKYQTGRYGYALLHFQKIGPPLWRIQTLKAQQLEDLLSGFKAAFEQPISNALWQWKYGNAPEYELCVWEGNQLIAHYGGMPRRILYFGQPQQAIQIGDVMVIPSRRGMYSRHGAFFQIAATFLERFIGFGKPFLLGFGFPNERAMRLAEHLGLYQPVDHIVQLSWTPLEAHPRLLTSIRCFESSELIPFAEEIDRLWQAMANTLSQAIVGVRDWEYILQRYIQHPEQPYRFLVIQHRLSRRIQAIAVIKVNQQTLELVDLLAAVETIDLLIYQIRRFLPVLGCHQLSCQISTGMADYFKVQDFHCQPTAIRIPANSWTAAPEPASLQHHWWLMGGDMDFC